MLHITPWERTALQLLADGTAAPALAGRFGMNEREVEAQLRALFTRMGAKSQSEAIADASRRGLVRLA